MVYKHTPVKGFTIVELLIVIVVIAILAAISIVAYNGIQQRARDARRAQDIAQIRKSLLMYQAEFSGVRSSASYAGNDDGGWDKSSITPWMSFLTSQFGGPAPIDPINNLMGDPGDGTSLGGYGYWYYCYNSGSGPNPTSANVRLGYRSEQTGNRVHIDLPVQACL